ncbi:sensor histidine kinase [Marivita sp. S0852]|uniref:sensor histidine kinase n=1 Tax=Marivita sp. S0852 TaxID=3373893 RepID=UPI00398213B6
MTIAVAPEYSHLALTEMQVGLEVARVGIGRVDYLADTIRLDGLSAELFGFTAGTDIPRATFHTRIHPDDWLMVAREVDVLLAPQKPDVIDLTHRILLPNGEERWVNARKRVTFDRTVRPDGPIGGVFAVLDVTEIKRAQQETELLVRELNHRTKNLITVVRGISRLLARTVAPEDFPEELNKRLMVLVRNQDAIIGGGAGAFDLKELLLSQLAPFDDDLRSRVTLSGARMRITADAAQVIGMIVHELATNAVKYGALSQPGGRVTLDWDSEGEHNTVAFVWREQGVPRVAPPSRQGFGSQVLETLPKLSLDADVSMRFDPGGICYSLRVPQSVLG